MNISLIENIDIKPMNFTIARIDSAEFTHAFYLIFYGPLQFFAKVNEIYPLFLIASNQLCKANVDIRIMAILLINIIMLILYNCIQGYYSALSVTSDKRNQD